MVKFEARKLGEGQYEYRVVDVENSPFHYGSWQDLMRFVAYHLRNPTG